MNKWIGLWIIVLVLCLPIESSLSLADEEEDFGEDIAVQVDRLMPLVVRTGLLEQRDVPVYALLSGVLTNPTISVPSIKNILPKNITITTKPSDKKVEIGSIGYIKPGTTGYIQGETDLSNLGALIIPIKRIPKEKDVPDQITVSMDAFINLDVSESVGFSISDDVLIEENENEWNREEHDFFGGYVRAAEVNEDQVGLVFYNKGGGRINDRSIYIKEGEERSVNLRFGDSAYASFKVKVNEIRARSPSVKISIFREDKLYLKYLREGERLFEGSEWIVEDITYGDPGGLSSIKVVLRNSKGDRETLRYEESPCVAHKNKEKCEASNCKWDESINLCSPKSKEDEKVEKECEKINKQGDCTGICEWKTKCLKRGEDEVKKIKTEYAGISFSSGDVNEIYKDLNKISINFNSYHPDIKQDYKNFIKYKVISDIKNLEFLELTEKQMNEIKLEWIGFFLKLIEEKGTTTAIESSDSESYYKQAIQNYETVINAYKDEKELFDDSGLAHASLLSIALIYDKELNDEVNAILYYEKYKELYPDKAIVRGIDTRIKILKILQEFDLKPVVIEDNKEDIRVVLYGLKSYKDESAKTLIEVYHDGSKSSDWYKENELIHGLNAYDDKDWTVKNIDKDSVYIKAEKGEGSRTLKIDKKYDINTKLSVRVSEIDLKKEAYITIKPDVRNAYTESHFKVNIPIEKRPFDLPLFGESIDEEIENTRNLINDLDKIIENIENLHDFWIKFCFVTFGTFWSYNLLTGMFGSGNEAVAKKKVRDRWERKYNEYLKNDKNARKSFDQYIFDHQDSYEKELEIAESSLDGIKYNVESISKYDNIKKEGIEYKDASFYCQMCEKLNDREYCNLCMTSDVNARLQSIVEYVEEEKNINTLIDEAGLIVTEDMKIHREAEIRLAAERELRNKFFEAGNNEKNENNFKTIYNINVDEDLRKTTLHITENLENPNKDTISIFDLRKSDGNIIYKDGKNTYKLVEDCTKNESISDITGKNLDKTYGILDKKGICKTVNGIVKSVDVVGKGTPFVSMIMSGRNKGLVGSLYVGNDGTNNIYVELERDNSGRIIETKFFTTRKGLPGEGDVLLSNNIENEKKRIKNELSRYKENKEKYKVLLTYQDSLNVLESTINQLDRKIGDYKKGEKIIAGGTGYTLVADSVEAGASCVDFMSPQQCKILFNACDPVICPASRCNLGGYWQVDNVVQTGLIGSTVLCYGNSVLAGGTVVMPVCITGILAGLKNIRTILQAYVECLVTSKVEGESVGVCDRIRSFYFCDMLWREGMAIINARNGIINWFLDKVLGRESGGGEYSQFTQAVSSSIGSLEYFTNDYAKNVFATYKGRALEEVGEEVCKLAIYGKAPGLGDFFDQVTRPESPPQFTAFFEEIPYQDIKNIPESMYQVYYHIYAGEADDIKYSVYLQRVDDTGQVIQGYGVRYIEYEGRVVNRRLEKGGFVDVNANFIAPSGYNQLCISYVSDVYGPRKECGFGKVSTGFGLDWLNEQAVMSDAFKEIKNEEECVSEGRLTSLSYKDGSLSGGTNFRQTLIGSFSTGLADTGIVRKCSSYNPGVGSNTEDWVAVGSCGRDSKGRDLGVCWLYKPGVESLLKDSRNKQELNEKLGEAQKELKEVLEKYGLGGGEDKVKIILEKVKGRLKEEYSETLFVELKTNIENINLYFNKITDTRYLANMYYYLGKLYEQLAGFQKEKCEKITCNKEKTEVMRGDESCSNRVVIKKCGEKEFCMSGVGCVLKDPTGYGAEFEFVKGELEVKEEVKKVPIKEEPLITAEEPIIKKWGLYVDEAYSKYAENKFSKELIFAVIKSESNGKFDAISDCGAVGLMQLMPETAKWLDDTYLKEGLKIRLIGEGIAENTASSCKDVYASHIRLLYEEGKLEDDRLNPYYNIVLGTLYLKYLNERFRGIRDERDKLKFVLVAYNWGEGKVINLNCGDYNCLKEKLNQGETKDIIKYVENVLSYKETYKIALEKKEKEQLVAKVENECNGKEEEGENCISEERTYQCIRSTEQTCFLYLRGEYNYVWDDDTKKVIYLSASPSQHELKAEKVTSATISSFVPVEPICSSRKNLENEDIIFCEWGEYEGIDNYILTYTVSSSWVYAFGLFDKDIEIEKTKTSYILKLSSTGTYKFKLRVQKDDKLSEYSRETVVIVE